MRIGTCRCRKHIRIRAQSNDGRAKLSPTFNSGWSRTMYQKRTPSTVSRSVISTCCPAGSVIWYVALAPESTSRYRHRLETSIGTRTLCGCIRRMASFALAWRSSPRQRGYSIHPRIAGLEAGGVCDPANGDYEQILDPVTSGYDRRNAGYLVARPRNGESYKSIRSMAVWSSDM